MVDSWHVPFAAPSITRGDIQRVASAIGSGWISSSVEASGLEKQFASRFAPEKFCLAVNSGTAALHLALLVNGIGPGDEVIIPDLTYVATAEAVLYCGAIPVLVDVDQDGLIDVTAIVSAATERTRAVIAVHYAGRMCDVHALGKVCSTLGAVLIEDSAHAIDSFRDGLSPGEAAAATAFSFFATKPITAGEGGMLVLTSEEQLGRARTLGRHGVVRAEGLDTQVDELGYKYNLPDGAAALASSQLQRSKVLTAERARLAELYRSHLSGLGLTLPVGDTEANKSSWHLFVIRTRSRNTRDRLHAELATKGVETRLHYTPLHRLQLLKDTARMNPVALEVSSNFGDTSLSLPLWSDMEDDQVGYVVDAVAAGVDRMRSNND